MRSAAVEIVERPRLDLGLMPLGPSFHQPRPHDDHVAQPRDRRQHVAPGVVRARRGRREAAPERRIGRPDHGAACAHGERAAQKLIEREHLLVGQIDGARPEDGDPISAGEPGASDDHHQQREGQGASLHASPPTQAPGRALETAQAVDATALAIRCRRRVRNLAAMSGFRPPARSAQPQPHGRGRSDPGGVRGQRRRLRRGLHAPEGEQEERRGDRHAQADPQGRADADELGDAAHGKRAQG